MRRWFRIAVLIRERGFQVGLTPWFDVFLIGRGWCSSRHPSAVKRALLIIDVAGHSIEIGR